jgi:hypothetical protein
LVTVPQAEGVNVNTALDNVSPDGNVSSIPADITPGLAAGLVSTNDSVLLVPLLKVDGLKLFVALGGAYALRLAPADPEGSDTGPPTVVADVELL